MERWARGGTWGGGALVVVDPETARVRGTLDPYVLRTRRYHDSTVLYSCTFLSRGMVLSSKMAFISKSMLVKDRTRAKELTHFSTAASTAG